MASLQETASQVRRDIVRMVHGCQSGHPGGSLGCADFLTALYFYAMKHDPSFNMDGKNEDVFFLSNGHIITGYLFRHCRHTRICSTLLFIICCSSSIYNFQFLSCKNFHGRFRFLTYWNNQRTFTVFTRQKPCTSSASRKRF